MDRMNPEVTSRDADVARARTFVHMQRSSFNSNTDSRGCFPWW